MAHQTLRTTSTFAINSGKGDWRTSCGVTGRRKRKHSHASWTKRRIVCFSAALQHSPDAARCYAWHVLRARSDRLIGNLVRIYNVHRTPATFHIYFMRHRKTWACCTSAAARAIQVWSHSASEPDPSAVVCRRDWPLPTAVRVWRRWWAPASLRVLERIRASDVQRCNWPLCSGGAPHRSLLFERWFHPTMTRMACP